MSGGDVTRREGAFGTGGRAEMLEPIWTTWMKSAWRDPKDSESGTGPSGPLGSQLTAPVTQSSAPWSLLRGFSGTGPELASEGKVN